jgi:TM2 domain-containing membrane protein YozV
MTYTPTRPTRYCDACAVGIDPGTRVCPTCGANQERAVTANTSGVSERKILPAFLLCFLLGVFGAHRFYVGKIGTAILMIVTIGGLGIWALIDLIMIVVGAFTDKEGNKLKEWT